MGAATETTIKKRVLPGVPLKRLVFKSQMVVYTPEEIKLIRQKHGLSVEEFAEWFKVSPDAIKSWEAPVPPPGQQSKHRECNGPAAVLMYFAALWANERGCAKNNLIRLRLQPHYRFKKEE